MPNSTTLTVRLPVETMDRLKLLAEKTRRTSGSLAAAAIRVYVAHELKIVEAIEAGQQDLAHGRMVPHDQVMREVRELIDARRKKVRGACYVTHGTLTTSLRASRISSDLCRKKQERLDCFAALAMTG